MTLLDAQAFLGFFKKLTPLVFLLFCGCQIPYIVSSGYHQAKILTSRVPIEDVLKNPKYDENTKKKLSLVLKAREFAKTHLKLKIKNQYTSYVLLDRPYVSYVLSAAKPFELKKHLWSYPIVGNLPYKGFFTPEDAKEEERHTKNLGLDTYLRGVSAYSTLGWFDDPVLSSMIRYEDHDLVNLIIHESVHATLYIKSKAEFNERLATFLANIGTRLFYEHFDKNHRVLKSIEVENHDELLFSKFISTELKNLELWYKNRKTPPSLKEKTARLNQLKERFQTDLKKNLKTSRFSFFEKTDLNNAFLLNLKTYMMDLSDFEKAYEKMNHDFVKLLEFAKSLESSNTPEIDLKKFNI